MKSNPTPEELNAQIDKMLEGLDFGTSTTQRKDSSKMATEKKGMSDKARRALNSYRAKLANGEIDVEAQKKRHIEDLEAKLKKAEAYVLTLKQKIDRAKNGGVKTATLKAIKTLTAEQLIKLQELIANGQI